MAAFKPRVMTIYGTRPEAIKVAPVVAAFKQDERFDPIVVSTGQHREILEQVNARFGIEPDHDMALMKPGQSLNELVTRAIEGLDKIIEIERPDIILSQGDTSTAMAAALAGFHRGVRIAHLEAGLRTGDILSPFPEEANRKIIGQISTLHLAPTAEARKNLIQEGVQAESIAITGNTVIDSLLAASGWQVDFTDSRLRQVVVSRRKIILVTTHRRENLSAMRSIGGGVHELALKFPEAIFVLPLHPNPEVRSAVLPEVSNLENVCVTDPLPYDQFTSLMSKSHIVLTDSGGVQEEAPSLGKPVLVMRENTERPEAVEAGTVKLVGTDQATIVRATSRLIEHPDLYTKMANAVNPYGDGQAAQRVVAATSELLGIGKRLPDFLPLESKLDS